MPPAIAITNARLFDSESMKIDPEHDDRHPRQPHRRRRHRTSRSPPTRKRIDAAGKTVIPGLWDMHVHLGDIDGLLDIASGVTTRARSRQRHRLRHRTPQAVRRRHAHRTARAARRLPRRPRPVRRPDQGPGRQPGRDHARRSTSYASLGYVQIKIYSSIKPELVPFITSYAHSKGLRVSGHIPAFMCAEQAVQRGLRRDPARELPAAELSAAM